MRTSLPLLSRRIAALRQQLQSEFPAAEHLRLSPRIAERIETTPIEHAAAAALAALDDLAQELASPASAPKPNSIELDDDCAF